MSDPAELLVRFWGVRGSLPTPGPETVRYGGNTACVEVRCGDDLIVLDAGTGIQPLGVALAADGTTDVDLLLTHTHLDHIAGLPFFAPLFGDGNRVRLWAGHLGPERALVDVIGSIMSVPFFPVPIDRFAAEAAYRDFVPGEVLRPKPSIEIRTAPLNHPGRATGYRIERHGRSVCYVTDTEHAPGVPDERVLDLIRGADLVIYDCTYTDEELPAHVGWGHSTWEEGARLCEAAGAGTLAIFHHDLARRDDELDAIGEAAARARPGTIVAREGLILRY